ncbi:MAG: M48 family metallopeptidase [Sumerlaeia bacterium]
MPRFIAHFLPTLAIFCAVLTTGCATFRTGERAVANTLIPPAQEAQLGQEYAKQIEQEVQIVDDPLANEWVREMGNRILEHSPSVDQEFTFQVTADKAVNAFAIPGGFCYVNLGLILYAENEAQVAAVMAHEISHVTMDHGIRSLTRQVGLSKAAEVLGEQGTAGQIAALALQGGGVVAVRQFSQRDELEADAVGVEAMYEAGYHPREAVEFFKRLHELGSGEPSTIEQLISTHPTTPDRIQALENQIANYNLSRSDLTVNSPQFQKVQERLRSEYGGLQSAWAPGEGSEFLASLNDCPFCAAHAGF